MLTALLVGLMNVRIIDTAHEQTDDVEPFAQPGDQFRDHIAFSQSEGLLCEVAVNDGG